MAPAPRILAPRPAPKNKGRQKPATNYCTCARTASGVTLVLLYRMPQEAGNVCSTCVFQRIPRVFFFVLYPIVLIGQVLLSSHLGRPKDGPEDKFSLAPVSERLTKLLGKQVTMAPDCIGPEVGKAAVSCGLQFVLVSLRATVSFCFYLFVYCSLRLGPFFLSR